MSSTKRKRVASSASLQGGAGSSPSQTHPNAQQISQTRPTKSVTFKNQVVAMAAPFLIDPNMTNENKSVAISSQLTECTTTRGQRTKEIRCTGCGQVKIYASRNRLQPLKVQLHLAEANTPRREKALEALLNGLPNKCGSCSMPAASAGQLAHGKPVQNGPSVNTAHPQKKSDRWDDGVLKKIPKWNTKSEAAKSMIDLGHALFGPKVGADLAQALESVKHDEAIVSFEQLRHLPQDRVDFVWPFSKAFKAQTDQCVRENNTTSSRSVEQNKKLIKESDFVLMEVDYDIPEETDPDGREADPAGRNYESTRYSESSNKYRPMVVIGTPGEESFQVCRCYTMGGRPLDEAVAPAERIYYVDVEKVEVWPTGDKAKRFDRLYSSGSDAKNCYIDTRPEIRSYHESIAPWDANMMERSKIVLSGLVDAQRQSASQRAREQLETRPLQGENVGEIFKKTSEVFQARLSDRQALIADGNPMSQPSLHGTVLKELKDEQDEAEQLAAPLCSDSTLAPISSPSKSPVDSVHNDFDKKDVEDAANSTGDVADAGIGLSETRGRDCKQEAPPQKGNFSLFSFSSTGNPHGQRSFVDSDEKRAPSSILASGVKGMDIEKSLSGVKRKVVDNDDEDTHEAKRTKNDD